MSNYEITKQRILDLDTGEMYQEHDSVFHSNGKDYDLNKVFAITHDKRTIQIFLSTLESILNISTDNLGFIDWQRVSQTDLQYPLILSIADGGFVIVDGYHRFLKAVTTGQDLVLQTKYITPEELETTRICA